MLKFRKQFHIRKRIEKTLCRIGFLRPKYSQVNNISLSGFHGDSYLQTMTDMVLQNSTCFVETGTYVGTTVKYVAKNYPSIKCLSCEPDPCFYRAAINNTKHFSNVILSNSESPQFLRKLDTRKFNITGNVTFWLDAHGYGFSWPLKEELNFITSEIKAAYIFIDDFKVPGNDQFGFDEYDGQECSLDYVKDSLNKMHEYDLYLPEYTERTSSFHPLRGWILIDFGHDKHLRLPETISKKIKVSNNVRIS